MARKDVLDLNFIEPNGYTIQTTPELEEHGKRVLEINDLSEKLKYYNDNICSLSYYYNGEGLFNYGNYDNMHGVGTIFFKKGKGANDDANFEIYLENRQIEIDRLKNLLDNCQNYADKLKCFIEQKAGQYRFDELFVYTNEYQNYLANNCVGNSNGLKEVEIKLKPYSKNEIEAYNKYLYAYIERLIENPAQFHRLTKNEYKGFLSLPAKEAIGTQINKAFKKSAAKDNELRRIEAKFLVGHNFDYVEMLYPYEISNLLLWQSALFNNSLNGGDYLFSKRQLSVKEMQALYHVEQVCEYYKYLYELNVEEKKDQNFKSELMDKQIEIQDILPKKEIKLILERTELKEFLSVPAPDNIIKDVCWHDENDNPIDCNIYHPKYKRYGFEDKRSEFIVASFASPKIHRDYERVTWVYNQYDWVIVCIDGNTLTNKDGKKVKQADFVQTHQKKLAEGEQDFELIYQRELESKKLIETKQIKSLFCNELISHVNNLIELHKERSTYNEGRGFKVLALANEFVDYLKRKIESGFLNKSKPQSLKDIFNNDTSKVSIITEAIKDLNITKDLKERPITGFIDGCKDAGALPEIATTELLRIIYNEIGKVHTENCKPRYDTDAYSKSHKKTKEYFGIN